MPASLAGKAARFRALHDGPRAFVIANAFDAGSAVLLAKKGFECLATSSGAAAGVLGRRDGEIPRDQAMAHALGIAAPTDLPVSGDLENGFGDTPSDVAETIRRAGACGLVGGSIEDYTGDKSRGLYPLDAAVQRVEAAVKLARSLPFPGFVLTARAENFLRGRPDLGDSLATSLWRAAMAGVAAAADEVRGSGSFGYVERL